jgi:hypothetical protein
VWQELLQPVVMIVICFLKNNSAMWTDVAFWLFFAQNCWRSPLLVEILFFLHMLTSETFLGCALGGLRLGPPYV